MKLFDQVSGRPYYVNQYMNVTQWESPNVAIEAAQATALNTTVAADQNKVTTTDGNAQPFGVSDEFIADRIAQAALNKQKSASNKPGRFKKQDAKGGEEEETSEFRKLFNAAHKNQGNKDATTGACNVR